MKSNWSIQPIKNGSGMMLIVVYSKKDVRTCAATRISSDLETPDLPVSGTPGLTSEADNRDGRPAPRGTLPAGRGGFPAPTRPVKMIKTAGKLRGKIKARI